MGALNDIPPVQSGSIVDMLASLSVIGNTLIKTSVPDVVITGCHSWQDEDDGTTRLEVRAESRKTRLAMIFTYEKRVRKLETWETSADLWELVAMRGDQA